jgi:hypothetical protein
MVWTGVLQRLGLAASARDWDNVRHRAEVRANINELSGCGFEALPHGDTLKYLMARIDPGEFNKVLAHAFRRLREARRLEIFRFRGGFTVALDGVEFNRTGRPIPRSCHRTLANGGTEYFQVALVASLVSGISSAAPVLVLYVFGMQFYESLRYVFQ